MGNYKPVEKQMGTPMYYQWKAGAGAQLLYQQFGGATATQSLKDTKSDSDYKTPLTLKLKIMGYFVHSKTASANPVLIYENSTTDSIADGTAIDSNLC